MERFNDFYCEAAINGNLNWRGLEVSKNPCDLWMMVELIQRPRPRVIVETETDFGGSALCYADMMRLLGMQSTVITIDYNPKWKLDPKSYGIESLVGYSTDPTIVSHVNDLVRERVASKPGRVLVVLDSDHSEENVYAELNAYPPLTTVGSYAVVEDTNANGYQSAKSHGPGRHEAAMRFLSENRSFEIDRKCQRFLRTFNPDGWLRRVS